MCGIAGIVTADSHSPEPRLLEHMARVQSHRGPDQSGVELLPGAGFAHRRLSIIDPDTGRQPARSADGRYTLVYNGEIYNFPQLTKELAALGYRFEGHCDTNALLHAWQAWGPDCIQRLRGMFAFAVWDATERRLFLVRDRLGIKPLYYGFTKDGDLLFGSELKALLVHPRLAREIEPRAVEAYMALGYVPDPYSIYKTVYKLPPGHIANYAVRDGEPAIKTWWDLQFPPPDDRDEWQAEAGLRERLQEAVRMRMVADVPLGAFLSGGVDSSIVVAEMAGLSAEPVKTCAVGFDRAAFDEGACARRVADLFKTQHLQRQVGSGDYGLLPTLARIHDEPFADSSALPTYRVCELARGRVKVALSGDGSDESFLGYRRYRLHGAESRARGWLPRSLRRPVFTGVGRAWPKMDWAPRALRAKTTLQSLALDTAEAYCHSVSVLPESLRGVLYSKRFHSDLQGYRVTELFREHANRAENDHPLCLAQYLDFKTYLPGDILTKVDRASMAHGLEVRVPFLDHELVTWAAGLAPGMKLRRGEGKNVLKHAFTGVLPDDILYRRKMGFSVPLAAWFRGPLRETSRRALTTGALADSGYFNPDALHSLWKRHVSGRSDHGDALWSLLMLSQFLEGEADGVQPGSSTLDPEPAPDNELRMAGG